jgi:hypothetical protein
MQHGQYERQQNATFRATARSSLHPPDIGQMVQPVAQQQLGHTNIKHAELYSKEAD